MAPMSAGDKLMVREIVREVVQTPEMKALLAELSTTAAAEVVAAHQATCPVAKQVNRAKWMVVGALIAGSALGLSAFPLLAKLIAAL